MYFFPWFQSMNIFSGVIDAKEIVEAFKEIGIDMDIEEATFILQKYD